jgi:transketolase
MHNVNSGHSGESLVCLKLLVVFDHKLLVRKENFRLNGKEEDLFYILSLVWMETRASIFGVMEVF